MRSKSSRKPLRDVSSAKTGNKYLSVKSANNCKKTLEGIGDDSLDRLLVVHSDLSSLMHQIDELVVQGLQLPSKKEKKELDSFADVLSEMHILLKPWVSRFQKVLSSQLTGTENKSEPLARKEVSVVNKDISVAVESPEKTRWESLISPSPLVSWRTDCNTEGGRQLFLLTPLPRPKAFSSKCQASSKSAFEKITSDAIAYPSSLSHKAAKKGGDHALEDISVEQTETDVLDFEITKTGCNLESECASPAKFSRANCSMLVMTPSWKVSPPKSCVLLEPVSEFPKKDNQRVQKSTPFPIEVKNSSASAKSESSSSPMSHNLAVKYPELFGIKLAHNFGNSKKGVQESPDLLMSPPKTCVIMEPPDDKLLTNISSNFLPPKTPLLHGQQALMSFMKEIDHQDDHCAAGKICPQDVGSRLEIVECTPVVKEPESSIRVRKHPGENTLKKELWTKFEAVSTHGIRFNVDVIQKTAEKGFLDRLDEAYSDE
ncbi:unnamed protein product [Fraxinus pennsylvanica]|uniref:Uncharacterized protein n=1 Tax=Fraxinus pennsylvanica TaxID=56036 RepID=A0AAD1YLX2_9LAMI|nr:unnamed protein product [Fraxinus pennsylvanica]